ncbi:MAG: hypothetical protein JST40_00875 [Armatimonadetes bacterium]|nr:hypothetical protein [Armatimonadota bacterium]
MSSIFSLLFAILLASTFSALAKAFGHDIQLKPAAIGWSCVLGTLLALGFAFANQVATASTAMALASCAIGYIRRIEGPKRGKNEERRQAVRAVSLRMFWVITEAVIGGIATAMVTRFIFQR